MVASPVLVGREDLLALADRRLSAPTGEALFLAGEAGIGKTRLLGEIVGRARSLGYEVLAAGASPGDTEVAGGPLADLGTQLRRHPGTAAAGERLGQRLRELTDGDAASQRRLLVADLTDLLAHSYDPARPLLITMEDLHWADDLTLDVLARLAQHARTIRLLVIGTYRSDELYPRIPMRQWRTRLLTQRLAEEVRLPRLRPDETAVMAAAITGASLPTAASEALHARSDGIPLHVEEFLATPADPMLGAEGDQVPDTLAEAVLARAATLTTPTRALAEVASVLGRSFDLDLLTTMTGDEPAAVDEALRELTEQFFVRPSPDGAGYTFRHALIRDALYSGITPLRRRALHARAAGTGLPDALASDHYERAGRFDEAFRHARAAAREASALSAHREAAELYRRARRTWPSRLPRSDWAGLLTALACELTSIDENEEAAACYAEAYDVRLELDDKAGAAALVGDWVAVRHLLGADLETRTEALRAALPLAADHPRTCAELHAELAAAYMLDRRLDEALASGEQARALGVEDRALCHVDATVGSVLLFAGRTEEGTRLLRDAITRATGLRYEVQAARSYRMLGTSMSVLVEYDEAERTLRPGIAYAQQVELFNDRHYMAAHLAHVQWATGDWTAATTTARQALADGGGITTEITARHVLGFLALGRGSYEEALDQLTRAERLGSGMRELQRLSPAWWGLAELALATGDTATAIARCDQGFAASAAVGDAAYLFPYVVTGTRAHLAATGPTAARAWLTRTTDLLRSRGIPGTMGALDHARGLIQLQEGRTGKARDSLAVAAAFWRSRRRFWEGAAVLVDQARCARRSRRPGESAAFVEEATRMYSAAGAPTPAEVRSDGTPALLSAREIEVARLIAAGLTNREIAVALTIAPKTAAAHAEHIRTKLGVSRRAQIATWVTTTMA